MRRTRRGHRLHWTGWPIHDALVLLRCSGGRGKWPPPPHNEKASSIAPHHSSVAPPPGSARSNDLLAQLGCRDRTRRLRWSRFKRARRICRRAGGVAALLNGTRKERTPRRVALCAAWEHGEGEAVVASDAKCRLESTCRQRARSLPRRAWARRREQEETSVWQCHEQLKRAEGGGDGGSPQVDQGDACHRGHAERAHESHQLRGLLARVAPRAHLTNAARAGGGGKGGGAEEEGGEGRGAHLHHPAHISRRGGEHHHCERHVRLSRHTRQHLHPDLAKRNETNKNGGPAGNETKPQETVDCS